MSLKRFQCLKKLRCYFYKALSSKNGLRFADERILETRFSLHVFKSGVKHGFLANQSTVPTLYYNKSQNNEFFHGLRKNCKATTNLCCSSDHVGDEIFMSWGIHECDELGFCFKSR